MQTMGTTTGSTWRVTADKPAKHGREVGEEVSCKPSNTTWWYDVVTLRFVDETTEQFIRYQLQEVTR